MGSVLSFTPYSKLLKLLGVGIMNDIARIILWTAPRHSGKSTGAYKLAMAVKKEGHKVAGLVAHSVYEGDKLIGFDAENLRTSERVTLSRGNGFQFTDEGKNLGLDALDVTILTDADLVIVDEYGPFELKGQGWRSQVDQIIKKINSVILLVVRESLIKDVTKVYRDSNIKTVNALNPHSIDVVAGLLN